MSNDVILIGRHRVKVGSPNATNCRQYHKTAALASAVLLKYAEAFFSLSTPEPDAEADSPLPMGGTTPLQNYVESNVQVSSGSTTTRQWFGRRSRTNITMQSGSSISASSSSSLSSGTCIWELRPDAISRILSDIADMKMWVIDIEDEKISSDLFRLILID